MTNKNVVIIGFGSLNGNDQAGWWVIDNLKNDNEKNVILFKSKADGADWFPVVENATSVIFVDAVKSDERAGFVHVVENSTACINNVHSTSHTISIFESIELAKSLAYLKVEFQFFGIEIKDDNSCTDAVRKSINNVSDKIRTILFKE